MYGAASGDLTGGLLDGVGRDGNIPTFFDNHFLKHKPSLFQRSYSMARTTKAKAKSLKITRKKKPRGKKTERKRLVIKVPKFNRLVKKARTMAKKSLKAALKGTAVTKITDRTGKKIDTAIAKDPAMATIIQNAIIAVVNTMTAVKPPKAPKTKKEKKPKPAATDNATTGEAAAE